MKRVRVLTMALAPGPVIRRVRPGEIIDVPDDFNGGWFVELGDTPPAKEADAKSKRAPRAMSEMNAVQATGPIVTN